MNTRLPPRLRTPALVALLAIAVLAIGGAVHGWETVLDVLPVPIAVIVGMYLWAGRDSDAGALIRHHLDERQAAARLKVQAFVGRVLSLAVAVAYVVASTSNTTLWPWAVLLGLTVGAFLIGWLMYGEHRWRRPSQQ
jgi:hypothetical protein